MRSLSGTFALTALPPGAAACYARRLHAWRMADGSERYWAREIDAAACDDDWGTANLIRAWSGEAA